MNKCKCGHAVFGTSGVAIHLNSTGACMYNGCDCEAFDLEKPKLKCKCGHVNFGSKLQFQYHVGGVGVCINKDCKCMKFDPVKSQVVDVGAGTLIGQYIKEDPVMSPMRPNVEWVLDLNYPKLRLLNGIYYGYHKVSPIQVQVLLFDGFDWVLATKEHPPGQGLYQGITEALKVACEALKDVDEEVQQDLWNDLMNNS